MTSNLTSAFLVVEAVLHSMNRLIDSKGNEVGIYMLLVDFKNAFNLVDMSVLLEETKVRYPSIASSIEFCYAQPARLYYDDFVLWSYTLMVVEALDIKTDGLACGLFLNIDKTEIFMPVEDPRSRAEGIFTINISCPLNGVKLLGSSVSLDEGFCRDLALKGSLKPSQAQVQFDLVLRALFEKVVITLGLVFGDWQWRFFTLSIKLDPWHTFTGRHYLVCFSYLSFANERASGQDIDEDWHQTPSLSLSAWYLDDDTIVGDIVVVGMVLELIMKDGLGLGQTMNGDIYGDNALSCAGISAGNEVDIGLSGGRDKTLRLVDMLHYSWDKRLDVYVNLTGSSPLTQTRMADLVTGCVGLDDVQRKRDEAKCTDTGYGLLSFSFSCFGELEKDVVALLKQIQKFSVTQDIGALADDHIFSSSPLTQTGMVDFVLGHAVLEAAHRKRVKYEAKCVDIRYGFLPFSFSSFGELKKDAVTLLKRIRKFFVAQNIRARAAIHIFSRIGFAIAKREAEGSDFVSPLDCGDGVVRFVLYDLTKPHVPSSLEQLDDVDDLVQVQHGGFSLALLDSLFLKGLCTVKSITLKCRLGFSRVLKEALDKVICTPDDISCWVSLLVLPLCLLKTFRPRSGSLQVMRETLAESSPPLSNLDEEDIDLVLSSSGVAPYNDATLEDLKTKHPFKPPPLLPHIAIDHHHLVASPALVLDRIKSFPRGTSCGRDGLRTQHLMDCLSGVAVAISDELVSSITQVVNLFLDGKCPQQVGRLVSKVSVIMIGHSLDGYLDGLQFGVGVAGGSEAILHSVNRLIEACGDDVGLSMLLVDLKNAFNLVDQEVMLREVRLYDGTIVGDTVVVGKVLELIMEDGLQKFLDGSKAHKLTHISYYKTAIRSRADQKGRLEHDAFAKKDTLETPVHDEPYNHDG
ncbi:hypothetical protein Tco_1418354 [Tanacetum coccineum]